jgi:hypothetical protein
MYYNEFQKNTYQLFVRWSEDAIFESFFSNLGRLPPILPHFSPKLKKPFVLVSSQAGVQKPVFGCLVLPPSFQFHSLFQ